MATSADGNVQFGFGIEIELVLRVKGKKLTDLQSFGYTDTHKSELAVLRNRIAVSKYIKSGLDAAGLLSEIRRSNVGAKNYAMWGIERDASLQEDPGCYGVEIVSPKLFGEWQHKLRQLFNVIDGAFVIVPHNSAGTHVRVAPVGQDWTMEQIRQISKGIVAWTANLKKFMPRPRDDYAAWNTAQWTDDRRRSSINSFDVLSRDDIVQLISPERYCAWNYRPLLDTRGTIEFRRPPQVKTAAQACHWVAVTLCLLSAFSRLGDSEVPLFCDSNTTRRAIRKEARKLGLQENLQIQNHKQTVLSVPRFCASSPECVFYSALCPLCGVRRPPWGRATKSDSCTAEWCRLVNMSFGCG